jgi:hypothetical protein
MQRGTFNPLSKKLMYWDIVTSTAMLYTAFVTPFEVGSLNSDTSGDALFMLNRAVDGVFLLDIFLTFFVPYRASASEVQLVPPIKKTPH